MPPTESFYFYDLETTGRDPRWHRVIQFAGVRTGPELEPLEEPVSWLVALDDDVVPEPEAALVTGLTPRICASGIDETELFRRIADEFGRPRTCVTGFNNLRFDDEFVRYGFWRNLRDPYAREWQGGNSRWDLIDLARLAAALRPEGTVWPEREGRRVFRLEDLAAANGIEQVQAHDAVSDVLATLGLARHLKQAQPRLYDYYLSLRSKAVVSDLVLPVGARPFVHVSGRYPGTQHHLALAGSVATHPVNRNSVIVADLSVDPDAWAHLPAEEIADRLFAPSAHLGDRARPPLKEVHLNKVPAVAPLGVLGEADAERLGVDTATCLANLERLRALPDLAERIRAVHTGRPRAPVEDVDGSLYDGFLPDTDRDVMAQLRDAGPELLVAPPPIDDPRARELVFRFRARRHPATLNDEERAAWSELMRDRLGNGRPGMSSITEARARVEALRKDPDAPDPPGTDRSAVLSELDEYLSGLARRWGVEGRAGE